MVMNETLSRVRTLHGARGPRDGGPTQRHKTASGRGPQAIGFEADPPWTEAETKGDQAFGFGPRGKVLTLVDTLRFFSNLAGCLLPGQPPSDDLPDGHIKAVAVRHVDSVIEAKRLLIDVTEKVERFHADVSAVQAALQETPEVLNTVGVNLPINVLFRVVNHLMIVVFDSVVHEIVIGVERAARFHVLRNTVYQLGLVRLPDDARADLAVALQESLYGGLADLSAASAAEHTRLAIFVHVPRLAANVSLIHFDFARQFAARVLILHCEPDALKHKPTRLLGDLDGAGYFVRTDAVLAVRQHPHREQPLVQADRGVLENGSDLDAELRPGMPALALPDAPCGHKGDIRTSAGRADYAVFPAPNAKEANAVINVGKIDDCFLKRLWFGCHKPIMRQVA
jgi:hypothetical protein